jgi:hypothetical protein
LGAASERTLQTVLDEIFGRVPVAHQRVGIAPERRDRRLDLVQQVDGAYYIAGLARCQTPLKPSPVTSPAFLSPFQL